MKKSTIKRSKISAVQSVGLLRILKDRFEKNMSRHKGFSWDKVETALKAREEKLQPLFMMEETGGEPDVVVFDKKDTDIVFVDCSLETPKGRRSVCFDKAALDSRKEHKPENSAVEMAQQMGVELLTEAEYRTLQKLGDFDLKTSSWIATPESIRKLGGAVFCDKRYNTVFLYHNGAESYYASRGFRGSLKV